MADIHLTTGHVALVDDEDAETIDGAGRWFAIRKNDVWYAVRAFGRECQIYMHTFLMMPDRGLVIDHINGNGLDNRKTNLRAVRQMCNIRNRAGAQANSRSGVRGVYRHSRGDSWVAQIRHLGKKISLGCYSSIEDAKAAREAAEAQLWTEADRYRAMVLAASRPEGK